MKLSRWYIWYSQTTPGKKSANVHVLKGQKQILQSLYLPKNNKNSFQEGDYENNSAIFSKLWLRNCSVDQKQLQAHQIASPEYMNIQFKKTLVLQSIFWDILISIENFCLVEKLAGNFVTNIFIFRIRETM